jgi:tetratricopeptide (TPR) repeat protein
MKRLCLGLLLMIGLSAEVYAQKKGEPKKPDAPKSDPQMEQAKALFAKGEEHFKVGEFEQALEAYKESYKLSKAPLLLLNMGQCQVKLKQYAEAKHSYEALLREDPNTPYRVEVEEKIVEMDRLIAEEKARQEAASQVVIAASQPLVIIDQSPPRKKGLLIGGVAGGFLLGGGALTLLLLTRDDGPPPVPIPGSELGTFDSF